MAEHDDRRRTSPHGDPLRSRPRPSRAAVRERANDILEATGWGRVADDADFNAVGGGSVVAAAVAAARRQLG